MHPSHSMPTAPLTRSHQRLPGHMRPVTCSHGLLHRADGSAQFALDKTIVIAGVHGPFELNQREEKLDRATLHVVYQQNIGLPSTREKFFETTIQATLESLIVTKLHPRTKIQISVQTIQNDGSLLAAAFNTICLALMDAGVPLCAAFAAVSLVILPDGTILVDPTAEEEDKAQSLHTFVFDGNAKSSGPYMVHSKGEFTFEQFSNCYEYATTAVSVLLQYMQDTYMSS